MKDSPPVFLVAAERSGSTLLRLMLDQHPDIAFAGEFEFLVDAISPDGKFLKRDAFVRATETDRIFHHHNLSIAEGLGFAGIARSLIEQVGMAKPGARLTGVTLHRHFDRVLYLWPDARFIHLVRDGRDVALSAMTMGWAGNMWQGISKWVDVEALWQRMAIKLPPERQITVKYEALTIDPEAELRRIATFLGVDFDQAMLRYPQYSTYSAPYTASVGRWKTADIASIRAAEYRGARWLLQNGYLLSGTVRPPSLLRRITMRIQDRHAISAHRRALLGLKLWLTSLTVQRIGTKEMKARNLRLQNEIIDRSLK